MRRLALGGPIHSQSTAAVFFQNCDETLALFIDDSSLRAGRGEFVFLESRGLSSKRNTVAKRVTAWSCPESRHLECQIASAGQFVD